MLPLHVHRNHKARKGGKPSGQPPRLSHSSLNEMRLSGCALFLPPGTPQPRRYSPLSWKVIHHTDTPTDTNALYSVIVSSVCVRVCQCHQCVRACAAVAFRVRLLVTCVCVCVCHAMLSPGLFPSFSLLDPATRKSKLNPW